MKFAHRVFERRDFEHSWSKAYTVWNITYKCRTRLLIASKCLMSRFQRNEWIEATQCSILFLHHVDRLIIDTCTSITESIAHISVHTEGSETDCSRPKPPPKPPKDSTIRLHVTVRRTTTRRIILGQNLHRDTVHAG